MTDRLHRHIRSFVRRQGRLTPPQKRALEKNLPAIRVTPEQIAAGLPEFDNFEGKCYFEIGFGNGNNLAEFAVNHPASLFLGAEVHGPGVGHLLLELEKTGTNNVRILHDDARLVLDNETVKTVFDGIYLLFPDPWHKKRHHKRRIVNPAFVDSVMRLLKPGGFITIATDWEHYAEWIEEVFYNSDFELVWKRVITGEACVTTDPEPPLEDFIPRIVTKYERRGQRLEHTVTDLVYQKPA